MHAPRAGCGMIDGMTSEEQTALLDYLAFLEAHHLYDIAQRAASLLWAEGATYARSFDDERELARRQVKLFRRMFVTFRQDRAVADVARQIALWARDHHPAVPRRVGQAEDAILVFDAQRRALTDFVDAYTQDPAKLMLLVRALDTHFITLQRLSLAVVQDVRASDARRIEHLARELAQEKELLERVINHAPAVIGFADKDLRMRWLNPAGLDWMKSRGLSAPERPFHGSLDPDTRANVRRVLATGETLELRGAPIQATRDDGLETTYWDLGYVPVRTEDGQLSGVLILAVDVTARVGAETVQRAQIAELQSLDRLRRNFINAASHELRTPLTSIMGYAEFLEDQVAGDLTKTQHEFVREITHAARRLRRLVDDLLDFARMEAGTFSLVCRPADLAALLVEELKSLEPQAQRAGIRLELKPLAGPIRLRLDEMRVGQVLLNLVGNALKFTPAGGSVTVSATPGDTEVVVSVQDTGIGIAPEDLPRVFEKFYQVDPSNTRAHGGAGLGLSICKAIVEAHGGRMGVLSEPGQGSTFWFSLPTRRKPARVTRASGRALAAKGSPPKPG